jgi:hypothetical protein
MSSSYTNQPPDRDPRHEEGYTPTPPPPDRGWEEDEVEEVRPKPKLGSLAQKARGDKLKQARGILLFIGGATIVLQIFFLIAALNQNVDAILAIAIHGLFIFVGVLFIMLGLLVYRFPLPITILSLVLYIFVSLIDLGLAAMSGQPGAMGSSLIWKIIFIVALASSIRSAAAYEKERREEQEYTYDG